MIDLKTIQNFNYCKVEIKFTDTKIREKFIEPNVQIIFPNKMIIDKYFATTVIKINNV